MPQISLKEIVSDLKEYLPDENVLSNAQLENIANNIVENQIEVDDEDNYSEALCKSLQVAAKMNHMKFTVDGSTILEERVGGVSYKYSEDNQRDIWKKFEKSLPDICPFLPKGGYNMPTTIGVFVKKADEIKINSCDDDGKLIL